MATPEQIKAAKEKAAAKASTSPKTETHAAAAGVDGAKAKRGRPAAAPKLDADGNPIEKSPVVRKPRAEVLKDAEDGLARLRESFQAKEQRYLERIAALKASDKVELSTEEAVDKLRAVKADLSPGETLAQRIKRQRAELVALEKAAQDESIMEQVDAEDEDGLEDELTEDEEDDTAAE